jgi:hypothetical protein
MNSKSLRTVISGSYRRHLKELYKLKNQLETLGIDVLSPVGSFALNPTEEFVFLDADPVHDKRLLQDSVFGKIRTSTFLVLANFDGYMGKAALMEIGYALSFGLQILTVEPVEDPNIGLYTRLIDDVFPNLRSLQRRQEVPCEL